MAHICRACLDSKKTLFSADSFLLYNFNLLTNLDASLSDDKPHFFCSTCYKCIQELIWFREKCIESNKTLDDSVAESTESYKVHIKTEDEPETKHFVEEKGYDSNEVQTKIEPETNEFDEEIELDIDEVTSVNSEVQTEKSRLYPHHPTAKGVSNKKLVKSTLIVNKKVRAKKTNNKTKKEKESTQILQNEDVLNCGLCTETFSHVDEEKLNLHIDSHKNDMQCNLCKEYFTEWPNILAHRIIHLQKKQLHCHLCKKYHLSEFGLEYHYRNIHFEGGETKLSCKLCNMVFQLPRNLRRHVRTLHGLTNEQFQCHYCSKICKSRDAIRHHLRIHAEKKDFICDDCGLTFNNIPTLTYHIRREHLKMSYCTFCQKLLKNQKLLEEHKAKCTKSFTICPVCGKKVLKKRLKRHMGVHSDVRKYKCTRCPAGFKSKTSLNAHIDRHEGYKRYKCTFCSSTFYTSSSLLKHERIHTGEKPYKCKICEKAFTSGYNLKVHMKVHGEYLIKKKSLEPENN